MATSGGEAQQGRLLGMIVDQDTATGLLLTGVGNVDLRKRGNFLIVDDNTSQVRLEEAFKEFTNRDDVAVLLISQHIANVIRYLLDAYTKPVPAILEIPSKDHPYDPSQDSILSRVKFLFGAD